MAHIFCRNLYANTVYRSVKKYCKKTALCKYYVYYTIVLLEVFCNLCIKYDLFFLFILLLMCLNCVYVWIYIWIVFIYVPKYMFTKSINENAYQFYHWLLLTSKMVFFIFGLENSVLWICFGSYEGGMKVGWKGLTLDSELHNGLLATIWLTKVIPPQYPSSVEGMSPQLCQSDNPCLKSSIWRWDMLTRIVLSPTFDSFIVNSQLNTVWEEFYKNFGVLMGSELFRWSTACHIILTHCAVYSLLL